ncbi:MAG: YqgE/AlgH family protein [Gammaproteobacteria bacterium]|nr:YqgE/AlgH family protein [Gammaproteobacteria bacterium]
MESTQSLANQFLIAMPALMDPNFVRTVTLICQHNEDGALGVVINRSTTLKLHQVLDQLSVPKDNISEPDAPVFLGGPVQTERGLILHEGLGEWETTLPINDMLGLTTSKDILEAIGDNRGPKDCLLALGYAGWGSGQLEREMRENAWLSGPSDNDIIFRTPVEERWPKAAQLVGVDISRLSGQTGHA